MTQHSSRAAFPGPDSPVDEEAQPISSRPRIVATWYKGVTTIVAVVGYANDWAAYAGSSSWSLDEISRQGDKILEEAARGLFPDLKQLHYRH